MLNTIRYLRMLDMPLAEIADFLHNRDVDIIADKLRGQKDIIRRYGLTANHTTVLLSRTRQKLRQHLEEEGYLP